MKADLTKIRSKIDAIDSSWSSCSTTDQAHPRSRQAQAADRRRNLRTRPRRGRLQPRARAEQRPNHQRILARDLPGSDVERAGVGETADHRFSRAVATCSHAASVRKFGTSLGMSRCQALPMCSPMSRKAGRTTASCRLKIRPKARSRTRTTCSWTANSKSVRRFSCRSATT